MDRSTSLLKALDVLTVLGGASAGLTVQSLAETLNLPRTTVLRILNTVVEYGFAERRGREYTTTEAFTHWASAERRARHRERYRGILEAVAAYSGELVLLGVLHGAGVVHIDFIRSDQRVRVAPAPETRHGLRYSAIGKLVLSVRPDLAAGWAAAEPAFARELAVIRREGVAWNRNESVPGMIALARHGFSRAHTEPKVAVAWPRERFTEERARDVLGFLEDRLGAPSEEVADHV